MYQNPYMGYQPYGMQQPMQQQPIQQQLQQPMQQQPVHGFVFVTGDNGAKAYQMPPNSEMPLFDSTSENRMFIKTTDGAGFPTIRSGKFIPDDEPLPESNIEYASIDDVNALRREIEDLRNAMYEGGLYGKHVSQATD